MITLIVPPSPYLIDDKALPHLGILYVASILEQKGYKVRVLDLVGRLDWQSEIHKIANQENELIGITVSTSDFPIAIQILDIIKSVNDTVPIAIGGAHPTVAPNMCKMFDKVIVGDGWTGVFLALKSSNKIIHGKMIDNLDDMPLPARHLIDIRSYHYKVNNEIATNVISQLGCPFSCIFCSGRNIPEYKKVRMRSPKNFISEIDMLNEKYGYSAFMISDDEFNLRKSRVLEMCRILKQRNYHFRSLVRTDLFTEEIAKAMSKSGFCEIGVGIESGSAKILKIIRKNTTPEINTKARKLAKKYGIKFKAFLIVGHPTETYQDVMMTKQWLIDNSPDDFEIHINTPYPGAPLYDNQDEFDINFNIDYSKDTVFHTRKQKDEHKCLVSTSNLTSEEIVSLREEIDNDIKNKLGICNNDKDK